MTLRNYQKRRNLETNSSSQNVIECGVEESSPNLDPRLPLRERLRQGNGITFIYTFISKITMLEGTSAQIESIESDNIERGTRSNKINWRNHMSQIVSEEASTQTSSTKKSYEPENIEGIIDSKLHPRGHSKQSRVGVVEQTIKHVNILANGNRSEAIGGGKKVDHIRMYAEQT
ncbi:hypothetical protein RND71_009815 [Anisodus tanguticus]|uniref:Uncharacterized protein n=1 Tax=Anisodus tanguticus TaxID=243964 RepID=A0AAE1SIH5_9SOLA|nr:hypothetical protein RND71_009815 [Anisodus tanguticus]